LGDNKRWFKVWTSIIMDGDMMTLTMEDRGRWMTLGALTAHNGINGVLTFKTSVLAHLLHVTDDVTILRQKIACLPNIKMGDCCNDTCTVTFVNWYKYQVDNSSERVSKYRRNVTMQEEKRREENIKNKKKGKKPAPPLEEKRLFLDFVLLSEMQYGELVAKFGEDGALARIKNLNDYGHQKPKKFKEYASHYHTILTWERKNAGDKPLFNKSVPSGEEEWRD
jgi:hypothetical protein